jgi:hypothetical protein
MTSGDPIPEVMEALWEAGEHVGRRLSVPDQVAVARALEQERTMTLTPEVINAVFDRLGLKPPSAGYGKAVVSRLKRLPPRPTLREVLLDYREFAIREISGQFGGKTGGREEELRLNLLTFLPARGYTEARTGKGKTDIVLPSLNAVIEVKVWVSVGKYEDGLEELRRYIHTERPSLAFMVVFADREPLPPIVSDHRQAVAEERQLEDLVVPVIVIPFEVDQPSKAGAAARRRRSGGRR